MNTADSPTQVWALLLQLIVLHIREILATFESIDPRVGFWNFTYPWRLSPQGLEHAIALDISYIQVPIFTQR